MQRFPAYAIAVLMWSLLAQPAAALETTPAYGGTGGDVFARTCEGGFVRGLNVFVGDYMDSIDVECTTGNRPPNAAGGQGGSLVRLLCGTDMVVRDLEVRTRQQGGFMAIAWAGITCVDPVTGKLERHRMHDNYQGSLTDYRGWTMSCDPFGYHFAFGIYGRVGRLVDQLGMMCMPGPAKPVAEAPPTKIPGGSDKFVIRPVGKGKGKGKPADNPNAPGDGLFCTDYAYAAVDAATKIRGKASAACQLTGPRYTTDFAAHHQWCLTVPRKLAESEDAARTSEIAACFSCTVYAAYTREQFEKARTQCGGNVGGPHWQTDPGGDSFAFCYGRKGGGDFSANPDASKRMAARDADLKQCTPPKGGGGGGGSTAGKECFKGATVHTGGPRKGKVFKTQICIDWAAKKGCAFTGKGILQQDVTACDPGLAITGEVDYDNGKTVAWDLEVDPVTGEMTGSWKQSDGARGIWEASQ